MQWTSAISELPSFDKAAEEACEKAISALNGQTPDIVLAFISPHHSSAYSRVPKVFSGTGADVFLGCSATAVIGEGRELENSPAIAVAAAKMPGVQIEAFEVQPSQMPDGDDPPEPWHFIGNATPTAMLLLPDPYTIDVQQALEGLDFAYPNAIKFGGLVSTSPELENHALFIQKNIRSTGMVGIAFCGDLNVQTGVSHSCRPVGPPMLVTKSQDNVIYELNGKDAMQSLGQVFELCDEKTQQLLRRSLQIGIPINRTSAESSSGDFTIRNVLGINGRKSSIAVGEKIREGQIVQFHTMDKEAAEEDLRLTLENFADQDNNIQASLLFTCLSRGERFFSRPNYDADGFKSVFQDTPLTGFFSNGQVGYTRDKDTWLGSSHLHGYTAAFTILGSGIVGNKSAPKTERAEADLGTKAKSSMLRSSIPKKPSI